VIFTGSLNSVATLRVIQKSVPERWKSGIYCKRFKQSPDCR